MAEESIGKLRHADGLQYFLVSRDTAQGLIAETEALGLLTYLLSLPPDWKIIPAHLAKQVGKSERTVRRWLTALRDSGYLRRRKIRRRDGSVHSHVIEIRADLSLLWPGETPPCGHTGPDGQPTDITQGDPHLATDGQAHSAKKPTPGRDVRHTEKKLFPTEDTRPRVPAADIDRCADCCQPIDRRHASWCPTLGDHRSERLTDEATA